MTWPVQMGERTHVITATYAPTLIERPDAVLVRMVRYGLAQWSVPRRPCSCVCSDTAILKSPPLLRENLISHDGGSDSGVQAVGLAQHRDLYQQVARL